MSNYWIEIKRLDPFDRKTRRELQFRGSPAHAGMDLCYTLPIARYCGLPRPRGDGPSAGSPRSPIERAPPPTRGWTLSTTGHFRSPYGSPAHAGMDPGVLTDFPTAKRLPRPRGDGPGEPGLVRGIFLAPPPTRGWTPVARLFEGLGLGSPAHAGMDPGWCCPGPGRWWLPRPRGDGPQIGSMLILTLPAPPPTRGWTPERLPDRDLKLGSPAHAGMDRLASTHVSSRNRLPRPRGDGPFLVRKVGAARMAPLSWLRNQLDTPKADFCEC